MKKFCYITILLFIAYSCKKNTTNTTPTNNTTTTVTSFSVDGVAVNNRAHSSFLNGGNYGIIAYGANSNPELQVTFSGTTTPTSGTYAITTGTVTYAKCLFTLSDTGYTSTATSGYVNVVTSPNNFINFSNISVGGNGGNHSLSGTITY